MTRRTLTELAILLITLTAITVIAIAYAAHDDYR